MDSPSHPARTFEESCVIWTIGLTYFFYAIGALYIVGPVVGWLLLMLVCWRFVIADPSFRAPPLSVWIWWLSALVLLFALVIAHLQYGLGTGQLIKSTIGWAKGWAMFAVFITVGACLTIRLEALGRAANILALQTVVFTPLLIAAPHIGLPAEVWVSPLKVVGGPGPEFFAFRLYSFTPDGGVRWAFFAPWAPGAGIAALVLFSLGMADRSRYWRVAGVIAALLMVGLLQSRLALITLPVVMIAAFFLTRLDRPWVLIVGAVGCTCLGLAWGVVIETIVDTKAAFDAYRSSSSAVRSSLQEIAQHRFSEAAVWGHGVQDKGTHLVEFMPIGSHHTWNGLLFIKGTVGAVAFAIPLIWSTVELIFRGHRSPIAKAGLCCLLGIWVYSLGENIEILVYLFWGGLVAVGGGLALQPGGRHVMPRFENPMAANYG